MWQALMIEFLLGNGEFGQYRLGGTEEGRFEFVQHGGTGKIVEWNLEVAGLDLVGGFSQSAILILRVSINLDGPWMANRF